MEQNNPNQGTKRKSELEKPHVKKQRKQQIRMSCSACNSILNFKSLLAHIKSKNHTHKAQATNQDAHNCFTVVDSPFYCNVCTQYFKSNSDLKIHKCQNAVLNPQDYTLWLDLNTGDEFQVKKSDIQDIIDDTIIQLQQSVPTTPSTKEFRCKVCGDFFLEENRILHEQSLQHKKNQKEHNKWLKSHIAQINKAALQLSKDIAMLNQHMPKTSSDEESTGNSTEDDSSSHTDPIEFDAEKDNHLKSEASEDEQPVYAVNEAVIPINEQRDMIITPSSRCTNESTIASDTKKFTDLLSKMTSKHILWFQKKEIVSARRRNKEPIITCNYQ
jgi:hypothetical protein